MSVRLAAVSTLAALVVISCSSLSSADPSETPPPPAGVPQAASVVLFEPIEGARSVFSLIPDRRRLVIRDNAEWRSFWSKLYGNVVPLPELPAVDFGRQMVIAATMGQRPSGGYAIDIADIFEEGGTLFPVVLETSPGPLCVTTQVITAPAVAVLVGRTASSVSFVEQTGTIDCG